MITNVAATHALDKITRITPDTACILTGITERDRVVGEARRRGADPNEYGAKRRRPEAMADVRKSSRFGSAGLPAAGPPVPIPLASKDRILNATQIHQAGWVPLTGCAGIYRAGAGGLLWPGWTMACS